MIDINTKLRTKHLSNKYLFEFDFESDTIHVMTGADTWKIVITYGIKVFHKNTYRHIPGYHEEEKLKNKDIDWLFKYFFGHIFKDMWHINERRKFLFHYIHFKEPMIA